MRTDKFYRTTAFRLTALYVTAFAVALALLGAITYAVVDHALERKLDDRIYAESDALQKSFRSGGIQGLLAGIRAHEQSHPNGAIDYAVVQDRKRIAGRLKTWPRTDGWFSQPYQEEAGETGTRRFFVVSLTPGLELAVAADPEQVEEVTQAIFGGFVSAFVAVLLLGAIGAIALSHALMKRVAVIRRTAEAIVEGDLKRRIPHQRNGDDFDLLSQTLNHMLDRISELMESLRQVSSNIAHDLKTPLAHLRNRLEHMRELPPQAQTAAIEDAVSRVDDILTTFSALLRIAQIEAGTRRTGFVDFDLSQLCESVVETFVPAAEDAGQHIQTRIVPGVTIHGDRELLTQAFANLIENAIRHAPGGTTITLALRRDNDHVCVSVTDTGPGIPDSELPQVFRRFYRGTNARDLAGTGLGLSLVKAVAELHGGTVEATNAGPGLAITLNIPIEGSSGASSQRSIVRLDRN